ncbi:hypothetical protein [Yersinia massiliensis]|uniref:hypothetical protein n=1 Tax=Yersinia massiliensis TaxID=419257 RepID=UPI0011A4814D|nr:hypothetical protein [Yersinia massiliensis]MCB5309593.1 hypothetical protein [Yersinia massiliensis]
MYSENTIKPEIGHISGLMVYRLNIKAVRNKLAAGNQLVVGNKLAAGNQLVVGNKLVAGNKLKDKKRDDRYHILTPPFCDSHHAQFLGSVALLTYYSNTALSLSLPTTRPVSFSGEMLMLISSLEGQKHHTTNSWPNAEFFAGRSTT